MAADIGQHLNDVVASLQKNEFECLSCLMFSTFYGNSHVPTTPCYECGKVNWKIHAINDKVIYP